MNTEYILWLLGVAVSLGGAGIGAYISIIQRMTKIETKFEDFVDNFGDKIAKHLHSPDDHLGLDALMDKYRDRHYELSFKEWADLLVRCDRISQDKKGTTTEQVLADFMALICHHKLRHDPPARKR